MSWTEERIDTLKTMWEAGQTASQIAEALGGVSRNAVIGKAHRLGLQSRPSPVRSAADMELAAEAALAPESVLPDIAAPEPEAVEADEVAAEPAVDVPVEALAAPEPKREPDPQPIMRSVGPGGFVRQTPGEQQPPIAPAPPRRLVPAKPSAEIAGKTGLLDLNDRICKWPLGHPGEPDFHFCGNKVNPGFPYCVAHCGHAYQAQLPRRDRRPPPPLPFGGSAPSRTRPTSWKLLPLYLRHPGPVPGSTVPRTNRRMRVRIGGPRNRSGVTKKVERASHPTPLGTSPSFPLYSAHG